MRLATSTIHDRAMNSIAQSQTSLSQLQDSISSGKRVTVASDDPVAAAAAERSLTRIAQLQAQQRALGVQRDALGTAEGALGTATTLLQRFRELTLSAGNAATSATDRNTLADEMQSIREQLVSVANTQDNNGVYLFSGWETTQAQGKGMAPVAVGTAVSGAPTYTYTGCNGQSDPTQAGVPYTMNGSAIFMQVPKGNGVFDVSVGANNTGQLSTNLGQASVTPTGAAMSNSYQIQFAASPIVGNNSFTYSVVDVTNPAAPVTVVAAQPYTAGQTIGFSATNAMGATESISLSVDGNPKAGDSLVITPYGSAASPNPPNDSLFALLDQTIGSVRGANSSAPNLSQAVAKGLSRLDAGMNLVSAARSQAGIWLNRADMQSTANGVQATQLEQDRSQAQDLDMASAISKLTQQNTGYQAALQSYASIQKMSLFDYLR